MPFLFQIEPQEIAENSFWVKAEEEKFENPELFAKLALTFGTQMKGTFLFYFVLCFNSVSNSAVTVSFMLCAIPWSSYNGFIAGRLFKTYVFIKHNSILQELLFPQYTA